MDEKDIDPKEEGDEEISPRIEEMLFEDDFNTTTEEDNLEGGFSY